MLGGLMGLGALKPNVPTKWVHETEYYCYHTVRSMGYKLWVMERDGWREYEKDQSIDKLSHGAGNQP